MFKNQLQELAQRSCFNLPAYACMREGPDHAPRFRATVNFNGEIFESPGYSPTLRQAEHAAAEVALNLLSSRGSKSLTARVLDETGVYKNLLQETAHKAGLNLPVYTTVRSGPGHVPVFTCSVELAGMSFTGESAKTKKQAEKNAAIAAWSALKKMPSLVAKKESAENHQNAEEEEQAIVRSVLSIFKPPRTGKQKEQFHHQHQNHCHNHPRRPRNTRHWRSNYPVKYDKPWKQPSEFPPINPVSSATSSTQLPDHPQNQLKQNSFVDLLPPPPPRATSKILPLSPRNNSIFKDDGHYGKIDVSNSTPKKPINVLQEQIQNHVRSLYLGPLSCGQMGILGNYSNNLKGIAPAVHVRSVIPVCAAPPSSSAATKPFPLSPPLPLKETVVSSMPTKLASEHVPTLNSELNKLGLRGD